MTASVWQDNWQWQLVIDDDSVTVSHVCSETDLPEPLLFEPGDCVFRCALCGEALSVRRSGGWGA